jgi:hypothetical protein
MANVKLAQAQFMVRLLLDRVNYIQNLQEHVNRLQKKNLERIEIDRQKQYKKDRFTEVQDYLKRGDFSSAI